MIWDYGRLQVRRERFRLWYWLSEENYPVAIKLLLLAGYAYYFCPRKKNTMRTLVFCLFALLCFSCGGGDATSAATVAAPVSGQEQRDLETPNIKLNIAGTNPAGALLIGQYADQQFRADSGVVQGNMLVFTRNQPYRPGHYFAYFPDGTSVQMLIDADQQFTLTAQGGNIVGSMQVEGSEDNTLLYDALKFEASQQDDFRRVGQALRSLQAGTPEYNNFKAERDQLVAQRMAYLDGLFAKAPNSLFTSFKRSGQNPVLREIRGANGQIDEVAQVTAYRYDFWEGVDFADARLLATPVIINKLRRFMTELTPQNADSIKKSADFLMEKVLNYPDFYKFFANWITLEYEPGQSTVMDSDAIHVHMITNYFTRERAFWADSMTVYGLQDRASQMAQSLVGLPGPNITVNDDQGQPRTLYDLDAEYILVYMYNPDCDHCQEETPKLVQWYQQHQNQVDVYAIALDTEDAKWKNFIRQYNMGQFTNVFDPSNRSIFKTYYVDNTPELYLMNKDRIIIAKNLKVSQLDEAMTFTR
jgi:peroxiredoxin